MSRDGIIEGAIKATHSNCGNLETAQVVQTLRVYAEIYYSQTIRFWGESKADTQASSNGVNYGRGMWFCIVTTWLGAEARVRVPMHGLGAAWFELCPCVKGVSVSAFLLACPEEQGL